MPSCNPRPESAAPIYSAVQSNGYVVLHTQCGIVAEIADRQLGCSLGLLASRQAGGQVGRSHVTASVGGGTAAWLWLSSDLSATSCVTLSA